MQKIIIEYCMKHRATLMVSLSEPYVIHRVIYLAHLLLQICQDPILVRAGGQDILTLSLKHPGYAATNPLPQMMQSPSV